MKPVSMKAAYLILATLMPASAAPRLLPPAATVYRPQRVRLRTTWKIATRTTAQVISAQEEDLADGDDRDRRGDLRDVDDVVLGEEGRGGAPEVDHQQDGHHEHRRLALLGEHGPGPFHGAPGTLAEPGCWRQGGDIFRG